MVPNRSDTHNPHSASTVLLDHNVFDFGNVESDVEDEGDWHDELTSKENASHPTRASEAMMIEVRSMQVNDSLLIFIIIESFMGDIQDFVSQA